MSDVTWEVDTVEFTAALLRLKDGVSKGFIDPTYGTLPVQGRLLAERCQTFTPPRNVGQGKAAVARDITRIFKPLSQTTFTSKSLKRIIQRDIRPSWDAAARHFGDSHGLKNTTAISFSEDFHKRNRISRGRGRSKTQVVTLGPQARLVRSFIVQKKKMVGWARAGWNAGIIGLGGNVKASWVSRHGQGQGGVQNVTTGEDPYVRVWNATSWAKYGSGEGERILNNAIRARSRDMESYYFRMMKLAAKASGAEAA